MDQKSSRPESVSHANAGTSHFRDPKAHSVSDSITRGKDAIEGAATDAVKSAGSDLQAIRVTSTVSRTRFRGSCRRRATRRSNPRVN
jgi:hypothetical protein